MRKPRNCGRHLLTRILAVVVFACAASLGLHPSGVAHSRNSNKAFVLIQYFGYLRRNPNDLPDLSFVGYAFWSDKLNQFNGNFVDAQMVKAFINSGEYRQRFGT